jgi:hypothetical protein
MNLKTELIPKRFLILQILIFTLGFGFLFICVLLNLPASNDIALLGLKAIIFMILFVVNTSSNSLQSSEFYYINKCECDNKNFINADDTYNSEDIKNIKTVSAQKLLHLNLWILNSSFFLIFSILINIIQSVGKLSSNSILKILSFYSFLIFLIAMIVNYLIFNCSFYKSLKKIIQ